MVAGLAKLGVVGQLIERSVKFSQVTIALFTIPSLLRVPGYPVQIRPSGGFCAEFGALRAFAIQFLNPATKRVLYKIACPAFIKHLPKGGELGFFFLFEQAQSRVHDLAGRGIAAALHLLGNEGVEVLAKGNARVFAHWAGPQ